MDLSNYKKVEHEDGRIELIPIGNFVRIRDIDLEEYPSPNEGGFTDIICGSSLDGILNIDRREGSKPHNELILVVGDNFELVPIEPFVGQLNPRFKVKIKK